MNAPTMFFWLLVVHALCDYPLQGEHLSKAKRRGATGSTPWYHALTAHALIQAGGVALVTGHVELGILEFFCHWVIDYGKCAGEYDIDLDQFFHIMCKVLWMAFAASLFR